MTKQDYLRPVDIDAMVARARAERGEYLARAMADFPGALKRLAARLRRRLPHAGAWA